MKSLNAVRNQEVMVLDNNMTFGNLRLSKTKLKSPNEYECILDKLLHLKEKYTTSLGEDDTENHGISDIWNNDDKIIPEFNEKISSLVNTTEAQKPFEDTKYSTTWIGNELLKESTAKQTQSSCAFDKENENNTFKKDSSEPSKETLSTPQRVFNKSGKPLTDRMGRPLADIMGRPLVVFDEKGRLVSDSKGDQVFNCLGESAAFSNTNLFVLPSEEEPGIPLLDIDKKHILFLYDNKGHPLTDNSGRPLVKASGSLMFGSQKEKINSEILKANELKSVYGKAPLENCVRHMQIFDGDFKGLTDENGKLLKSAKLICNKNGMPVCDIEGRPCLFKYGSRITESPQYDYEELRNKTSDQNTGKLEDGEINNESKQPSSRVSITTIDEKFKRRKSDTGVVYRDSSSDTSFFENKFDDDKLQNVTNFNLSTNHTFGNSNDLNLKNNVNPKKEENISTGKKYDNPNEHFLDITDYESKTSTGKQMKHNFTKCKHELRTNYDGNNSKEAIVLFDGSKKMANHKSLMNTLAFKTFKGNRQKIISHNVSKRKPYKEMFKSNFMEHFKNAINFTATMPNNNNMLYNDYGKPIKDIYGNLLYDKYGIPVTGANGVKLCEQARHALRLKLRNIPVIPINKMNPHDKESLKKALTFNQSMDQFGQPNYDKHGRPLYDLFGKLIYDSYGRPLTDAFGRPLIDAIGQPMMDSKGNVLTSLSSNSNTDELTDVLGRRLYDKRGRPLFDSYGRPRFDIFTNAIYDNCGRPATDGSGKTLYDFLNQPIKPYPEKPLYRNARALLPKYIDNILTMPSMHIVLKYSRTSLNDAFGGPLFDDFGRPMYNNIGKPVYDKYGRPLYNKDGKPLCDCYGRPLSEEICQSPMDTTLSVVDCLKLLKLTKESSKWMEIKRSEMQTLRDTKSQILDDAFIMKVIQPTRKKSTKYTYALTRVTNFSCGRQALEILEAPLSPATASEMHHLPVDNKPLIMLAKHHQRISRRRKPTGHK